MEVYRCGNCRKPLMEGAILCTHCEAFFDEPVPAYPPLASGSCYIAPAVIPIAHSRKIRNGVLAILGIAALMGSLVLCIRYARLGDSGKPTVQQVLDADIEADKSETYVTRRHADDLVLTYISGCSIQHSDLPNRNGDSVLMVSSTPLTPDQERRRVNRAATMLWFLRAEFFQDARQQLVSILLLDPSGRWVSEAAIGNSRISGNLRPVRVAAPVLKIMRRLHSPPSANSTS